MKHISTKEPKAESPHDFGQFSELSEFAMSPVSHSVAFIEFLATLLFNILRMACVPAELIFRRNFGERHFNLYLYVGGTMWLGIFATGWLNIPAMMGFRMEGIVPNGVVFTIIAFLFYGRMFWQMFFRKFGDIDSRMHSRYDGDPFPVYYHLPLAKDRSGNPREYLIRQLHEPVVMFTLGMLFIFILNPQTGTWLIISAFCMAVKEYVKSLHVRNILLDQIDAEIVGRNISDALKGEPPKNTQGVYIAGISNGGKDREHLDGLMQKNQQRFTTQAVH